MAEFKRGIRNESFINELQRLSKIDGWWRDVLLDTSLIIAIRDEYLNVYWLGQSIFRVAMQNGSIVATTHPKYLLDPALDKLVRFDGNNFDLGPIEKSSLLRTYEPGKTLNKLKTAAGLFAGDEKRGVHDIVISNNSVVDVEIAMQAGDVQDVGSLPRADIAAFEKDKEEIHLVLWEAKTFYNNELRTAGKKNVVDQIKKYKKVVAAHRQSIIKSYECIAKNLITISNMSGGRRKFNDAIRKVADGAELMIREPADVGLIVFGFDEAQRKGVWTPRSARLIAEIGKSRVKARGNAKGLKI
jgi:hypothetical protein